MATENFGVISYFYVCPTIIVVHFSLAFQFVEMAWIFQILIFSYWPGHEFSEIYLTFIFPMPLFSFRFPALFAIFVGLSEIKAIAVFVCHFNLVFLSSWSRSSSSLLCIHCIPLAVSSHPPRRTPSGSFLPPVTLLLSFHVSILVLPSSSSKMFIFLHLIDFLILELINNK